jgi:hypothetical protein
MRDMQKAQLLHHFGSAFQLSKEEIDRFLDQIADEEIKKNYPRIVRGLKEEDNYRHFFSALPWVKNVDAIDQYQDMAHKVNFQTPDYSILIEDSKKELFGIYVDVKSVKGAKESCEINPKTKHGLMNYSRNHDKPILLAIYWEKLGFWTHNCMKNLGGAKKNKISWQDALKNDVSHIFGDYTFVISSPFYRVTKFYKYALEEGAGNDKRGYFNSVDVGRKLNEMKQYSIIESAAIDAVFFAKEISRVQESDYVVVTEIFAETTMFIKTSSWLVQFLRIWDAEPSTSFGEVRMTEVARVRIVELMKDLNYNPSYLIPASKNSDTDIIFKLAYDNTTVWRDYNAP